MAHRGAGGACGFAPLLKHRVHVQVRRHGRVAGHVAARRGACSARSARRGRCVRVHSRNVGRALQLHRCAVPREQRHLLVAQRHALVHRHLAACTWRAGRQHSCATRRNPRARLLQLRPSAAGATRAPTPRSARCARVARAPKISPAPARSVRYTGLSPSASTRSSCSCAARAQHACARGSARSQGDAARLLEHVELLGLICTSLVRHAATAVQPFRARERALTRTAGGGRAHYTLCAGTR